MNKQRVKRLIKRLEKQKVDSDSAGRFNMNYFGSRIGEFTSGLLEFPVCGTQACLAGEAALMMGYARLKPEGGLQLTDPNDFFEAAGERALGLTRGETERLFFFKNWGGEGWPVKFEKAYHKAKTPRGRIGVAIRRLKYFIATDGR